MALGRSGQPEYQGPYRNVRGERLPHPREERIPGQSPDNPIRLMRGMDVLIRDNEAMVHEMKDVAKQVKISNQRMVQMMGMPDQGTVPIGAMPGPQREMVNSIVEAMREATQNVLEQLKPMMETIASTTTTEVAKATEKVISTTTETAKPKPQDGGTRTVAAYEPPLDAYGRYRPRQIGRGEGAPPEGLAPPEQTPYEQFQAGREMTIADLRKRLATSFLRGTPEELTRASTTIPSALRPGTSQGGAVRVLDPETGESVWTGAGGALMRTPPAQRGLEMLRTVASGVEGGASVPGSLMNMLPQTAGKFLGVAGIGLAGAQMGTEFLESQRAANARYQQMIGGGQGGAFLERGRERLFRFGQMGVMPEDMAQQLFQGVTQQGLTGGQRQGALEFGTEMWRDLGVSIEQSLEVVSIAAKNGVTSLSGLADAMRDITETAAASGVNVEEARKTFVRAFETTSQVFSGPGAIPIAQAVATNQALMGREYQNVDLSGLMGGMQTRIQAAQSGMPLNPFLAQAATQQGGVRVAGAQQQMLRQLTGQLLGGAGAGALARYQQREEPLGPSGGWSQAQIEELNNLLLRTPGVADAQVAQQVLQNIGGVSGLDLSNVMGFLGQVGTGQVDLKREARRAADRSRLTRFSTEKESERAAEGLRGSEGFESQKAPFPLPVPLGGKGYQRDIYLESVVKEDRYRSPIIENLLRNFDPDRKIKVQTREGEQVVSMDDALRYYSKQLTEGTAEIVAGQGAGKTVAGFTGLAGQEMGETGTRGVLGKRTESYEEFKKDRAKEMGEGRVIISPSRKLRELLRFSTYGSAEMDPAQTYQPPSPHIVPSGLPSGDAE